MKIRHEKWGEVDGVEPVTENWEPTPVAWFKDGADYPRKYGWSEITEPKYVDVTGEIGVDDDGDITFDNGECILIPKGYKAIKLAWFDLPENLVHDIFHMTPKGIIEYIQQFKKPCLIVEKEES